MSLEASSMWTENNYKTQLADCKYNINDINYSPCRLAITLSIV